MQSETYSVWQRKGIRYLFTLRDRVPHEQIAHQLRPTLAEAGFPSDHIVAAEQTHGNSVAVVNNVAIRFYPGVDALVTKLIQVPLVIRVADCGPIYLHDSVKGVIGLAHSGKKGTELNILGETIKKMQSEYGCDPQNISVFLGPCIRPPYYEVDFPAGIAAQALAAGITDYTDCGFCTATHIDKYYSYRFEKGQTGRMWAALMLDPAV